ncbi:MAG TPA: thiamine diphosphokinase [Eubacteriales bacterium]|jgi:thiamine pyrophosphokinase|nr:thiamine diphosphokinase [Clostridia bacterium]HRR89538.1 thiamine diphosphokinase [Eubacteriales bacterium]HRU84553.1 thiamine diphosphokinase [Eubacteriales bacterium]
MKKEKTAAIVLNGSDIPYRFDEDFVVFVDRGYYRSAATPDLIIGDFDSFDAVDSIEEGIEVIRLEHEKDETDGENALREVIRRGYKKINIYGVLGGRQDHVMCNLVLLALACGLGAEAVAVSDKAKIYYSNSKFFDKVKLGTIISIVPFLGDAHIMNTEGLKYPLKNETLPAKSTRGISNIAVSESVEVALSGGGVLIFVHNRG